MFSRGLTGGCILLVIVLVSACEIINPEETVPTYVEISDYEFIVDENQGTADQNISAYWIYLNGNLQGVYPHPSQFPLLIEEAGPHELIVGAGVELNGIASNNSEYFVFQRDTFSVERDPGEVYQFTPLVRYRDSTVFVFNEDFEDDIDLARDADSDDDTNLRVVTDTVFEGNRSGQLFVDTTHRVMEVSSLTFDTFPNTGTPVYIELNYRNSIEFSVGLIAINTATGNSAKFYKVRFRTREEWNKVYVDMTQEVADLNADRFRILIGTGLPVNSSQLSGTVYLDNVKLLHR